MCRDEGLQRPLQTENRPTESQQNKGRPQARAIRSTSEVVTECGNVRRRHTRSTLRVIRGFSVRKWRDEAS